ncbi:MAG: gamma-glutamylcyclotransferase family protein [Candidatus Micrarchaeia archaeon]
MRIEKLIFAVLACVLLAGLLFLASCAIPRQPIAFFAYGANLAKSTMEARAGGFLDATAAKLPGYSLAFASQDSRPSEFGVATPAKDANASVEGALYYLTEGQMAALDRQSGAPKLYERRAVKVALPDGSVAVAQAYFLAGSTHKAAPSRTYYLSAQGGLAEWGYGNESLERAAAGAVSPD